MSLAGLGYTEMSPLKATCATELATIAVKLILSTYVSSPLLAAADILSILMIRSVLLYALRFAVSCFHWLAALGINQFVAMAGALDSAAPVADHAVSQFAPQ